jgi:hypothetical protein
MATDVDLLPRTSTKFYNNNETSNNGFNTIEPRLRPPFYYRFPMDMDVSNRVGSGGGVHTVKITAIGGGGGGGGNGGGSSSRSSSKTSSSGNSNASTSETGGGGGTGFGDIGVGTGVSAGGGDGSPAGSGFAAGASRVLGSMEFIMTNSPENRMSAQWDGTDFGLLGAALESYRKGESVTDMLKTIADNPADASEYAVRKIAAMATAVKQLALGGTAPDTLSAATRRVENPFREQLFKTMNFRTFPMQFKIAPKSAAETGQVQNAIRELERNMHPEKSGLLLVYPSEFQVEFMYDGSKNEFLPTINACILTDMNVQYGHGGFMTSFANTGGAPTEITITLSFKEVFTRDRSHIE